MKLINKNSLVLFLLVLIIIFPFWNESSKNIYPAVEVNDSSIGYYQSTTCNISLLNVVMNNYDNELKLKFNNNNYAGIECFGKVTGLDKVNDVYIVSIGTNSNLTLLLQSTFWILFLLLISKFKFQIKNVNFLNVFLLSIFFTFQQFSEDRFYALVNKYFDLSLNTSNFYLFNNFLILYLLFVFISIFFENNKSSIVNYFPYMFLIVGAFNGFNLNFYSLIISYIGLKALFERKINFKLNIVYSIFVFFWSQTRRDTVTFFDTDKLNGFINSSNNNSSLFFWIVLFWLIINGLVYVYRESNLDLKILNNNFLISANFIVILGFLGAAFPLANFFNYIIFGQNKRGINSLASVDGNTWRGFSASAESVGEYFAFVLLFFFVMVYLRKLKISKYTASLLILPIYGLYESNNFAAILSMILVTFGMIALKYLRKNQLNNLLILFGLIMVTGSYLITYRLGFEYVSTQLLFEASLHSNLFTYLSSEAKSVEITRYFDANQIESLLNIENQGQGSSLLIYLSTIYKQSLFNLPYVPNLVTALSFVSIVINRNEMWGIFVAKYNPNLIESLFGNGPYQLNNYLYNLKIRLDVPEGKLSALYLPHSSLLDIFVFFGVIGLTMFSIWNFYVIYQKSSNPEFKLFLMFILLNFAKSDSILYLNSFALLVFIYAINLKSLVYKQ
tara:strand:+ start:2396 stop:4417 length:2022 start_codon:yes stop_codon:yes gene_type:complete